MSFRLKWSFTQAASSIVGWAVVMVGLSLLFYKEKHVDQYVAYALLLMIIPPLIYRWRQFYQMYAIATLFTSNLNDHICIGHSRAYSDILLGGHSNNTWDKYFLILDNGMLITANRKEDLRGYQSTIAKHPNYRKFLGLIVNREVIDARDPCRHRMPDLLE